VTRHPLPLALSIVAAVTIAFAPVARHVFVNFDDPQYVSENPFISDGLTLRGISWAFTTGYAGNWHPLTWMSHMVDVQVFGLHAEAHHVMNVVLHTASALLLFLLLYRMTGAMGRSWFVAALFAVHPLHVESVAWVAERKDVLSTLFWMLTIWAYLRYVRRPGVATYSLVVVLFALGLIAKPMLVTLPVTLLLLDVWPLRRLSLAPGTRSEPVRLIREKLPLFALAIASSVVTFVVQQQAGAVKELVVLPIGRRVANALVAYVTYIGKGLWPNRLAAIYPYPISIAAWQVVAAVLVLTSITTLAIRARRRHPYVLVGWLWYVVTLLPVIGLIQVGSQPIADRYTYVPLIGLFIIVAWGVPDLLAVWRWQMRAPPAAGVLVIVACTAAARAQVQHWRNSVALWEHAIAVTTANYRAQGNLGHALATQGRLEEAVSHYTEAVRIHPGYAEAHNNLGLALARQGKIDEAFPHYVEALRLVPDYFEAHSNLGAALAGQERYADAVRHFSEAVRIQPDHALARQNLVQAHRDFGRAEADRGNVEQALEQFLEAARLDPGSADVQYDLGVMFARKGDIRSATARFQEALKIDRGHQNARHALDVLSKQ
jgi:Flp pilus assembly protein TadD